MKHTSFFPTPCLWNCTMARTGSLRWLHLYCLLILVSSIQVTRSDFLDLGVNWGTMSAHPLSHTTVVNMLKDNGIKKVKLFDADSRTVAALTGSGIEVMLGIPNNLLQFLVDLDMATNWVKDNVTTYLDNGPLDIRYVAVGNEPFLKSYNGSFDKLILPAMQNIQKALENAGLGDKIKVTVPLNADVYQSASDKPSDGDFRDDIRTLMIQIMKFLQKHKSPFIVNIYPFLSLYQNTDFPFDYAFFDGGRTVRDKNASYDNVFDANYDTLVWTLNKNGFSDVKIFVGEIGWPTDGHMYGNVKLAKRFYDGLLKKLGSKKGTPLRPGPMDHVYLFGLLDENQKSIEPGDFERHWGIFRYDGQPKFSMDLSGKGNEKMLIGAKEVKYLPKQWCVLNGENKNMTLIPDAMKYACSSSDCTSLNNGSSCHRLDFDVKVSYAFNMYFQMNNQEESSCDFNGLGMLVEKNLSTGICQFPVALKSDGEKLKMAYAASISAGFVLGLLLLMQ